MDRARSDMTESSTGVITRWLQLQDSATQQGPLLSPGNEFPLRTLPSLPSDSSLSELDSDDEVGPRPPRRTDIAKLIHPPTPTMTDEQTAARRRSSSLAGATLPPKKDLQKHSRRPSEHIPEEGEDYSSDAEPSSGSQSDSTDFELDDMSGDGLEDDEETGLTKRDRRRRRRRKRRNTLLDQRIVPEDTYTKEEKKLADQNLLKSMMINGALIALWYGYNVEG